MKVYFDVVDDGRGSPPLSPGDVLAEREPHDFSPEDIGYLTHPVDLAGWIDVVRRRYSFLAELGPDEAKWATCSLGSHHEVLAAAAALTV